MKCVVTGAAGFIGSHLAEALLAAGHDVLGMDAFTPYYNPAVKESNVAAACRHPRFQLARVDLRRDPLHELLAGSEVVFHLAATPGLTQSWVDFDTYQGCNIQGTQRLLEAIRQAVPRLNRLIYVSTSSVYGLNASGNEAEPLQPISPYGVTKLAGEHLCHAYRTAFGVQVVVLRYFSVYGPRQRPDMGYHRFIEAMIHDRPVTVFGTGKQVRGNTYVADCVRATQLAVEAEAGMTYNVGGGETASVWDILSHLEAIAGRPARVDQQPARAGDQQFTLADTTRLRRDLHWEPTTPLRQGLAAQWQWQLTKDQSPGSQRLEEA